MCKPVVAVTFLLAILTVLKLSEAKSLFLKNEESVVALAPKINIFKVGRYPTSFIQLDESSSSSPPYPLQIYSPNQLPGNFPVLLFLHGSCLENSYYSTVLQFVATHGHIVIVPQLYTCHVFGNPISGTDEVEYAAKVVNWLPKYLHSVLPTTAKADLNKLTLGGHGRGGKTSFAMAMTQAQIGLDIPVAAVLAVDPVAGSNGKEDEPKILTYVPRSFSLSIPSTVIGTGLCNHTISALVCPACAPNDLNHVEFYSESTPPTSHIVITDYGHVDLLDDDLSGTMGFIAKHECVNGGETDKSQVRTTIAGTMAAFFNAYFGDFDGDYMTILHMPGVTPVPIDTPEFSLEVNSYVQI